MQFFTFTDKDNTGGFLIPAENEQEAQEFINESGVGDRYKLQVEEKLPPDDVGELIRYLTRKETNR